MYYYSPSTNGFYPSIFKTAYLVAGSWPVDAVQVSESVFTEFSQSLVGKIRTTNNNGMPCWIDAPALSLDELIATADAEKSAYITFANEKIAPLADAVELDIATIEEITQLKAWKVYRVLLTRIDTSTAPDIEWPKHP